MSLQVLEKYMNGENLIDLFFGGMEKLGPGDNAHTLRVLRMLPKRRFDIIVDAGCGTGRQTMAIARETGTLVHAIDSHEPFLKDLTRRAGESGLEHLVRTHCMDMKDIPKVFKRIDLLWAEGAVYNIGFSNALEMWGPSMREGGFAVVSELSWLREQVPDAVRDFFRNCYPGMQSVTKNAEAAENSGYGVLATHALPGETWVDGYYDVLEPRAKVLAGHPDRSVREFAAETLKEIEIFGCSDNSYGYVFYVLERP